MRMCFWQNQFAHIGSYGEGVLPIFYCIKYRETKDLLLKSAIAFDERKKDYYQEKIRKCRGTSQQRN